MELLADRFIVVDGEGAIDLATGGAVAITMTPLGGPAEQTSWAARCDALLALRQRSIATLVDYGRIGEARCFEAWQCGRRWQGEQAEALRALEEASIFLRACGLSSGTVTPDAVRTSPHGAVLLPGAGAGYPSNEQNDQCSSDLVASIDACGFVVTERRATAALAELFQSGGGALPRVIALVGAAGVGKSTVIQEAARIARRAGLVPVSARVLTDVRLFAKLQGRHLLLIDDAGSTGWMELLNISMCSPRSHILVLAGTEDIQGVDSLVLEKMSSSALVASVRPLRRQESVAARIRRAAERAGGIPGRFVSLLWPEVAHQPSSTAGLGGTVAAEEPSVYHVDEPASRAPTPRSSAAVAWTESSELTTLRRQLAVARAMLESGRHAAGARALRQTVGRLARRGDWAHAGEGALALAYCLLKRGHMRMAQAVLDEGRSYWRRAEDEPSLIATATLAGHAWIDLARLDEAESVLGAALAAARARADPAAAVPVLLAFARCMFWSGRYDQGERMLASIEMPDGSVRATVAAGVEASRLAIGLHDLRRGVGRALGAVENARSTDDPELVAGAAAAAAFAHLAVGDHDGVDRDIEGCLAAAHRARDPLRAIRARLLLAESGRRRGRRSAGGRWLARLGYLSGKSVPPIVAARVALLKDLLAGSTPVGEVVERHVASTGLPALALFAPTASELVPSAAPSTTVEQFVDILRVCQRAEEESDLLEEVCARVRRQIHAAAVAFVAVNGTSSVTIASDGGRIGHAVSERAMSAGTVLEPHRHEEQVEAAVPLRYGGAVVGALASRWTLGSTATLSSATAVLTIAATAAAPLVAAAVTQRTRGSGVEVTGLRGMSDAIADVRRAIERAARAPFAVLIEGESGSGKELVARAVHRLSPRRDRSFCSVNCAALPDDLIEAELFGHARGAFTGAVAERPGVFEEAHAGTLFLDEIGELSVRAQAKVLRVLQEGELRRVGENVSRRVDVRVVAATNRDLRAEAAAARFRLDLLYRLDVIRIAVPPLRERREDIVALAEYFWCEAAGRVGSRATLAATTLGALGRYDWPGNVRELQNVLAALAVRSPKRGVIPPTALPACFSERATVDSWRIDEARRTFEQRFVRAALVRTGGHRTRAASELGLSRQGLTKLMARLGITAGG